MTNPNHYADNDPLNRTDPTGQRSDPATGCSDWHAAVSSAMVGSGCASLSYMPMDWGFCPTFWNCPDDSDTRNDLPPPPPGSERYCGDPEDIVVCVSYNRGTKTATAWAFNVGVLQLRKYVLVLSNGRDSRTPQDQDWSSVLRSDPPTDPDNPPPRPTSTPPGYVPDSYFVRGETLTVSNDIDPPGTLCSWFWPGSPGSWSAVGVVCHDF